MKKLWFVSCALLLCGCFKVKDELALQPDGSGTVRIETLSSLPAELSEGMTEEAGGMGGAMAYPPTSEAEARRFFPGKDFTVTVKQDRSSDGGTQTTVNATFKDLNALLASPYGRAHALTVKIVNGELVLKGVSGLEGAVRFATMKPEGEMDLMAIPGLADAQKKQTEMRSEFRVMLPGAVTAAAGTGTRNGNTAVWLVERAKCKDNADFIQQVSSVLEARCSAAGLKLAPVNPVRLGLAPFKELEAGPAAEAGPTVDTNKIAAAARFVPYALQVTRSLDLSGSGGMHQEGAQLMGAVILPQELAPQKWDEVALEEAVDAKGNNLKPENENEGMRFRNYSRSWMMRGGGDEDEDSPPAVAEQTHAVTLAFKPPEWKVTEIARIKGSLGLHYFGGAQIVKLTNAIPNSWIMDASQGVRSFRGDSERTLASPKLSDLGLTLKFAMGMVQSGTTMLTLQVEGKQAALTDAQVFDTDGKPWPTFLHQSDAGEGGSCEIVVAGKPQAPLSLAFLASGSGAEVTVPILLEHVPLLPKAPAAKDH